MKSMLLFSLICLSALSCKPEHDATPAGICKLGQFVNSTGTNKFTYDATGGLSGWVIKRVFGNGKPFVVEYKFTRDAMGRISSLDQTITFDGKDQGTATAQFTYTNGLLTNTSTSFGPAEPPILVRTFTYDSNQRMSKRVVTDKTSTNQSTETYEYDSRGNCTRYLFTDTDGFKDERVFTYDTSKNPEQLLIKSIPFNLLTGLPWSVNVAVTTKQTYSDGTRTDLYDGKRTNLKTGVTGYVIGATETVNGEVTEETYTLTDCN